MKIAFCSDHRGYKLKKELIEKVEKEFGYTCLDFGCDNEVRCDFPIYAFKASESVVSKESDYGVVICGSRLWSVPGSPDFSEQDNKLYLREIERLKLSLKSASKMLQEGDKLVALIHYPPFNVRRENSAFTDLFEEYGVDSVIYGHLHGKDVRADLEVNKNGIKYYLTSCDQVKNKLIEIDL